jgi:large conductance mechanosensitive channel
MLGGNVVDLAAAVVMGAAVTAIVNSLINDLVIPLSGLLVGGIDFMHTRV